jgi:F420-dependent oxidoreductase-like protein
MRYGLKLSQNATIDTYRAVWRTADEAGFDHCWNMDHLATLGGDPTGDIFEAWTLLAAMAQATEHTRVGCMVTAATYRHPGVLAKMAVTVDHVSNGRLEFGLGAGWTEGEHTMFNLELGTPRERLDRLEEALRIVKSLWTEPTTTLHGDHYRVEAAIAEPKPVQRPHPPIWIGGSGRRRTLRIVAEHADAWNMGGGTPEELRDLSGVLDGHCAAVGRDPAAIRRTVQVRLPENPDDLLSLAEGYAGAGADDIIVMVIGEPERRATAAAALLPRLRAIG